MNQRRSVEENNRLVFHLLNIFAVLEYEQDTEKHDDSLSFYLYLLAE